MTETQHPTFDQLTAFDLGRLPPNEHEEIERHIALCMVCCNRLEDIADDDLVTLMRATFRRKSQSR
jgi:hypothetical protein